MSESSYYWHTFFIIVIYPFFGSVRKPGYQFVSFCTGFEWRMMNEEWRIGCAITLQSNSSFFIHHSSFLYGMGFKPGFRTTLRRLKLLVSLLETLCFTAWNYWFHYLKLKVSRHETKSFVPWNQSEKYSIRLTWPPDWIDLTTSIVAIDLFVRKALPHLSVNNGWPLSY